MAAASVQHCPPPPLSLPLSAASHELSLSGWSSWLRGIGCNGILWNACSGGLLPLGKQLFWGDVPLLGPSKGCIMMGTA